MARIPKDLLTYSGGDGAIVSVRVLNTKHTIGSLAKATGYSKAHISRIFRLLDGPSPEALDRIAKALRVDAAQLGARLLPPRRAVALAEHRRQKRARTKAR